LSLNSEVNYVDSTDVEAQNSGCEPKLYLKKHKTLVVNLNFT